jgi:hypothetical protein
MQAGPAVQARTGSVLRFAAEALAMCAVMCMGGVLLSAAFFVGLGQAGLAASSPALTVLVVLIALVAPMTAYMWIRHHAWGHNLSMTGATVVVGVVVYALIALGVIVADTWDVVFGAVCGPACVVMLGQMALGYDMYSGRSGHQGRTEVA